MKITQEDYLKTDAYKKGGKTYYHPQELLEIITNNVDNIEDVIIEVDKEGGAELEDGTNIITYGRGYIDATIKSKQLKAETINLSWHIGLIYSFDSGIERITVFEGAKISACTNLIIFNGENINHFNLKTKLSGTPERKVKLFSRKKEDVFELVENKLKEMSNEVNKKFDNIINFVSVLANTKLSLDDDSNDYKATTFIGELYKDYVIPNKLDYSTFNHGAQMVFDKHAINQNKELYELKEEDSYITAFQLYGGMTQRITDRKVMIDDIPTKTLEVDTAFSEILNIV